MTHRKITIEFVVRDDDLLEGHNNLMKPDATDNPQLALVNLIQFALYDDDDGAQLEGQFTVTGNEVTDEP